jgi:hypothetical protein
LERTSLGLEATLQFFILFFLLVCGFCSWRAWKHIRTGIHISILRIQTNCNMCKYKNNTFTGHYMMEPDAFRTRTTASDPSSRPRPESQFQVKVSPSILAWVREMIRRQILFQQESTVMSLPLYLDLTPISVSFWRTIQYIYVYIPIDTSLSARAFSIINSYIS